MWRLICLVVLGVLMGSAPVALGQSAASRSLRIVAPSGYLPGLPLLVRVEVVDVNGRWDRDLWEAEALLQTESASVELSTNRVILRHGIGSALVAFSGSGDFRLNAAVGTLRANRNLRDLAGEPVTRVGGILPQPNTAWGGVVRVTNDVTVPAGYTLTLQSNTIVLIDGTTNAADAIDLAINGRVVCLGTETQPVVITCGHTNLNYRWGQIRHSQARSSRYDWAFISRGGWGTGEGHTGTAPMIRPSASQVIFENCSITDAAELSPAAPNFGKPGKILQSSLGADVTFKNCLLARAAMGPEISETAMVITNCSIQDMRGPDDCDGLFLDAQRAGQSIVIADSVIAEGDDDGIDTLGAVFTVENSIIRGWRNPREDSKGISIEGGEARVLGCLLADLGVGVSGKGDNGVHVRLAMDHSTVIAVTYAVGITNKSGTQPVIDYRITNSILRGVYDTVFTQYNPADIKISFSNLGEAWMGQGNQSEDPKFVNAAGHDFFLSADSPCIDAGDPLVRDADGSRSDMGYTVFLPPAPVLAWRGRELEITAFPGRNYVLQSSTNLAQWVDTLSLWQGGQKQFLSNATPDAVNFFRVRLAP